MSHWYEKKEVSAGHFRLKLLLKIYKVTGRRVATIIIMFVTFFSFCFSKSQRRASYVFFTRLYKFTDKKEFKPSLFKSYKHFLNFSISLLDRIDAWTSNMLLKDINIISKNTFEEMDQDFKNDIGCFMISTHIGNIEMLRAISTVNAENHNVKVNVFLDKKHTAVFNDFINDINPESSFRAYSATDVGVDSAIIMKERIEQGECVVIAGDRVPSSNHKFNKAENFLGGEAYFPMGVFKFAQLMECKVYAVAICKEGNKYNMHVIKLTSNSEKDNYKLMLKQYVLFLQDMAIKYPYQWFNYFDFWLK